MWESRRKARYVLHLNMVSSFFLIYLCLMQAISFAVQYSSATFGILLNVGSFLSVLDTYEQMAKNLAGRFFMQLSSCPGVTLISHKLLQAGLTICTRC